MKDPTLIFFSLIAASALFSVAYAESSLPVFYTEKTVHLSKREREGVVAAACSTLPNTSGELRRVYTNVEEKPRLVRARIVCVENTKSEIATVQGMECLLDSEPWRCYKMHNYRKARIGAVHAFMYVNDVYSSTEATKYQDELLSDQEAMLALLRMDNPAARKFQRAINGKRCQVDSWKDGEWIVRCFQDETAWRKYSSREYVVRKTCNSAGCSYSLDSQSQGP